MSINGSSQIYYDIYTKDTFYLRMENFFINNNVDIIDFHRENGPSIITYYFIGDEKMVLREHWYFNGQLHRLDGPSIISYNPLFKKIEKVFYALHGRILSKDDYETELRNYKLIKILNNNEKI